MKVSALTLLFVLAKSAFGVEDSFNQVVLQCNNIVDNVCFEPDDIRGTVITDFSEVLVISIARGAIIPTNIQRRLEESGLRGSQELATLTTGEMDLETFFALEPPEDVQSQDERHLVSYCGTACKSPLWCVFNCKRKRRNLQTTGTVVQSTAYDQNTQQVCRTSSGGTGYDGSEFIYKGLYHNQAWCEDQCDQRSDCVAYQFTTSDGKCNLWTEAPGSFAYHHPATCNFKRTSTYKYHEHFVCRTASNGMGVIGTDYDLYHLVYNMETCEDMCTLDDTCMGYEYRPAQSECEIWKQTPPQFQSAHTANCNVKVTGTQTETHMLVDLLSSFPLTVEETDCLQNVQCEVSWIV